MWVCGYDFGDVTINPGATLSLYLRVAGKGNSCSYIDVAGTLKIEGNVRVEMNPEYLPAEGDEFQLWKADKFSGNPKLELPELPEGLMWDTTGLMDASGTLRVIKSSGVNVISDEDPIICQVYDSLGIYIGQLATTKATMKSDAKTQFNLGDGIYVFRFMAHNSIETVKVRITI